MQTSPVERWQPSAVRISDSQPSSERILLVEDEPIVRDFLAALLRRHGYEVVDSATPEDALEWLEAGRPVDLLITDIVMPGMNGWDLAKLAKQQRPTLRLLYMSGYADQFAVAATRLQPGATFLQKPFTITEMTDKVKSVLAC